MLSIPELLKGFCCIAPIRGEGCLRAPPGLAGYGPWNASDWGWFFANGGSSPRFQKQYGVPEGPPTQQNTFAVVRVTFRAVFHHSRQLPEEDEDLPSPHRPLQQSRHVGILLRRGHGMFVGGGCLRSIKGIEPYCFQLSRPDANNSTRVPPLPPPPFIDLFIIVTFSSLEMTKMSWGIVLALLQCQGTPCTQCHQRPMILFSKNEISLCPLEPKPAIVRPRDLTPREDKLLRLLVSLLRGAIDS